MSNFINEFYCTCCGKAVAKPRFLGGKPYGPSCYKKKTGVGGKAKAFFITAERLSVDLSGYLPIAKYKVPGIDIVFSKTAPWPPHAYAVRGGTWEDDLPRNAMQVIDANGEHCFKSLTVSFYDGVIIHRDRKGAKTTLQIQ